LGLCTLWSGVATLSKPLILVAALVASIPVSDTGGSHLKGTFPSGVGFGTPPKQDIQSEACKENARSLACALPVNGFIFFPS